MIQQIIQNLFNMDTISEALKKRIEARKDAQEKAEPAIKGLPLKVEEVQAITGLPKIER